MSTRPSQRVVPLWVWFAVANLAALGTVVAVLILIWPDKDPGPSAVADNAPAARSGEPARPELRENTPPAETMRSVEEVVADAEHAVVLITTFDAGRNKLGQGSGFVIDRSGLVATAFHVLERASSAVVEFRSRQTTDVIGVRAWDAHSDLAILEISNLPAGATVLPIEESEERPSAAAVISMGHPNGLLYTTTDGILSAVHKTEDLPTKLRPFLPAPPDHVWLQTNAAIAGGSSGGPLLNRAGNVIGINARQSGQFAFAIDVRHLAELRRDLPDRIATLAQLTGPKDAFVRLAHEYTLKYGGFARQLQGVGADPERQKIIETQHPAIEYLPRFCELAEQHADVPAAFDILNYACQLGCQQGIPRRCDGAFERAANQILRNHSGHPGLNGLLWTIRATAQPNAPAFFQAIADDHADANVRALALLCLGTTLGNLTSRPNHRSDALSSLNRVISEHPEGVYYCPHPAHPQHRLSDLAREQLYLVQHLTVGSRCLDIEGPDHDGKDLKLHDYRGKVIVLDFWAAWCPPCQKMLPLENKLVEEFKEKPFVFLGIFADDNQSKLRALVDSGQVTWRNWPDGSQGAIAASWRVTGYPTIYVIDHEGIIRHQHVGYLDESILRSWVSELIAEIPTRDQTDEN